MSSTVRTEQSTSSRLVLLTLTLVPGGILSLLSATIIGIAVPEIGQEFPEDLHLVHWVATAALLAAGISIPLSGWSAQRFGVRRTWLVALVVLAAGSVGAALAPTLPVLIALRVVQGLGAGALEPLMLTALARAAGPARMGRVMGIAGASMSLGPLAGPLLGGVLVESVGWRWILGGIALGAVVILLASLVALPVDARGSATLDAVGLILLSASSVALLAGLSRAAARAAVDAWVLLLLAIGILSLLALIRRLRQAGSGAIVDPRVFASGGFRAGVAIMVLVGAAIYPLLFGLPQFYRDAVGLSPVVAGLLIGPYAIGTLIAMPVAGRLSDRIGARPLVTGGAAVTAAAAGVFALLGAQGPLWSFAALSLVIGLGTGCVGGPTVGATYRVLPEPLIPSGSTVLFVANQIGGALGVALFAGLIALLSPEGVWDARPGTVPLLLPAAAALVVVVLARRLEAPGLTARR